MLPNSSISSSESDASERPFRRYAIAFVATVVAAFVVVSWLPLLAARVDAMRNFSGDGIVFVWGDSRTQHALDIRHIASTIDRPVWSFSRPAAGPYDLMVMEEVIPDGTSVVISPSLAMLARPMADDSNRLGLSWSALLRLWRAGYSFSTLHEIWVNNRYSRRTLRSRNHPSHEDADVILEEYLDSYRERLRAIDPATFDVKWRLIWAGIDRLLERGCRVYVVEAPISPMFRRERNDTEIGDFSDRLARAAAERGIPVLVSVELPGTPNPMWDHTHLNERGQARFTEVVLDRWADVWRAPLGG